MSMCAASTATSSCLLPCFGVLTPCWRRPSRRCWSASASSTRTTSLNRMHVLGYLIEDFLDPEINLSPLPVKDADGRIKLPALDNHGACSLRSRPLPAFGRTPPFHCRSTGEKSSSLAPPPGLRPNSPVPHPLPPAFGRRYLPPSLRSGGLIPRRGRNPRGAVRKKKPPG